ncbi:MAG: helix-turn-helix transcriptional regulator [Roseiarcus sp.]
MSGNQHKQVSPSRAIRLPEVCRLTGVSRATVWRMIKRDPSFPQPFNLSSAITAWDENEVFSWIAAKKNRQRVNAA